jgi:ATP-dependent DNA ligase
MTATGSSPGATATACVFSRNAKDWTDKVPAIVEAMHALPVTSATLDGEGVVAALMPATFVTPP